MLSIVPNVISIRQSYALMQVAGDVIVDTKPSQTITFNWGLLNEKNQSSAVNITAEGIGAEYLSFPENVTLGVAGEVSHVPVNVTIPSNYTGPTELTPSITATEAGEQVGATRINIAMSKLLCIIVSPDNATTTAANQELELTDYTQEVILDEEVNGNNQSIITIPIKSTSNITEFSFNQTRNEISFKASGDARTSGITRIFANEVLQEPYTLMIDGMPAPNSFENVTDTITGEEGIRIVYRHHCDDNTIILRGEGGVITPG